MIKNKGPTNRQERFVSGITYREGQRVSGKVPCVMYHERVILRILYKRKDIVHCEGKTFFWNFKLV